MWNGVFRERWTQKASPTPRAIIYYVDERIDCRRPGAGKRISLLARSTYTVDVYDNNICGDRYTYKSVTIESLAIGLIRNRPTGYIIIFA